MGCSPVGAPVCHIVALPDHRVRNGFSLPPLRPQHEAGSDEHDHRPEKRGKSTTVIGDALGNHGNDRGDDRRDEGSLF